MEIKNVEVHGLEMSLLASGYPMKNKPYTQEEIDTEETGILIATWSEEFDAKTNPHIKRGSNLAKRPSYEGHDTFLQGIIVQFDVDFTIKAWTEAQRYHFFDFVSSMSTMHKLKSFNLDESYIKYVDKFIINRMKELQNQYNENPTVDNKMTLLYSNPVGMKLNARMTTNYRQLKTIYAQRSKHALQEWRDYCDWILTLPLFCQLTGIEKGECNG